MELKGNVKIRKGIITIQPCYKVTMPFVMPWEGFRRYLIDYSTFNAFYRSLIVIITVSIMTSSNGNIFHVTGPLCGEFTGHWWFPNSKASDVELWCFFDLRLNKPLSKQSRDWWFETQLGSLWRHYNGFMINYEISSLHPLLVTCAVIKHVIDDIPHCVW